MKRWGWRYWAVLIGFSTAVFITTRWFVYLALLSILSFFVTLEGFRIIRKEIVDYLHDNHPEEWAKIAREMTNFIWYRRDILSYDVDIEDADYKTLRNEYRSALWAFRFSYLAFIATFIYAVVNSPNH